jgi:hypothetical protein
MVKESIAGIAIVGIIAYLFIRSKGSNSILESNFKSALEIENLQRETDTSIVQQREKVDNFVIPDNSTIFQATSSRRDRAMRAASIKRIREAEKQKPLLLEELNRLIGVRKSLNVHEVLEL